MCLCVCDEGGGEGERGKKGGRTMKMRNKKQSALGEEKRNYEDQGTNTGELRLGAGGGWGEERREKKPGNVAKKQTKFSVSTETR